MSGNTPVKEPTIIDVETVLEAIKSRLGLVGIAADVHELSYEPRSFPGRDINQSDLKVTIKIKQSAYRPINREGRLRIVAAVEKVSEPWNLKRHCTIIHHGVEIARLDSWPNPISIHFEIINDEPGRPTEVDPDGTFPGVTAHATSPLDIVLGLHTVQKHNQLGCVYTRFTPESVLCAILVDPVWVKSEDPLWPLTDSPLLPIQDADMKDVIERLWKLTYRATTEKRIRAISWATALELMHVLDNFEAHVNIRRRWQDKHGKYTSIGDDGVMFSVPKGGPEWPDREKAHAEFARIAVRAIDEFSKLEGTSAALSWDVLSMNTVKHLHAMSLGFLAKDDRVRGSSVFLDASKRGKELLETVRWPI